jgi:hypothetical protein
LSIGRKRQEIPWQQQDGEMTIAQAVAQCQSWSDPALKTVAMKRMTYLHGSKWAVRRKEKDDDMDLRTIVNEINMKGKTVKNDADTMEEKDE